MERRSNPNSNYDRIELAIEFLAKNRLKQPSLREVAKAVGLSEFHFQRIFKKWAGVSPKNLLQYLTLENAKKRLLKQEDILSTSLEMGLSGPSRLHDLFVKIEGMTPGEYKRLGKGLTLQYGLIETPFGPALIAASKRSVCHFHFMTTNKTEALRSLKARWPLSALVENQKLADTLCKEIFLKSKATTIQTIGSPFQLKVWEALLRIPEGRVATYEQVARLIGEPQSARAVGSAIASNEVALLIPCHRVIKANGLVGEYRWGEMKKKSVLCYEALTAPYAC